MAEKKKNTQAKHKKTVVKKHRSHKVSENKVLKEELPQKQESQEVTPSGSQPTTAPTEPTTPTETTNPLGGSVVASSGVLRESPKDQGSQPEPQPPQPQEQQSQQQFSQDADTLVSQPASTTIKSPGAEVISKSVEPAGSAIQDPLTTGDVVGEPEEQSTDDSKKKQLWIIIAIIIVVLVLIGGALWYFRENVMKRAPVKDEIPAPSILKNTPTPASDSAKLEIDFSEYKVQVLNGSGISGEAARAREILEQEEFNVEVIGNADNTNYEGTIIRAKKEVPEEFLDKLKTVIEESYILDSSEELEDSEEVDIIIIIGSSKQP